MRFFFAVSMTFLLMLGDFWIGCFGLTPGLTVFSLAYFYLTGARGIALLGAVLAGLVFDLVYGREFLWTAPAFASALLVADWSCTKAEARQLFDAGLPGIVLGAFWAAGSWLPEWLAGGREVSWSGLFWRVVFCGSLGCWMFPVLVMVMDGIGSRIGVSGFCDAEPVRLSLHRISLENYRESRKYRSDEL